MAIGAYVCLAARNVGCSTIHSLLGLKFETTPETVPLITDSTLQTYIKQLDQLKVLLFDEISYIGGRFLYCIDYRLRKIKRNEKPFGGLTVIFIGDFYQLKALGEQCIFQQPQSKNMPKLAWYTSPWKFYSMYELTKVVRQNEINWIELLNRVRVGLQTDDDIQRIKNLVGNPVPHNTH